MDRVLSVIGGLLTATAWAAVAFTAVWAGLFPLLFFGAADWPGFLETHLAVGAIGLGLGTATCLMLVAALPVLGLAVTLRRRRSSARPSASPSA
ncbi:hypothetical protein [Rhodoplanes serenus]|uniref:hypothetical protein n=1 Tax=Rhodoplanes serenus TaxID=200615 RepID=UPI0011B94BDD|nr:hypothetical protein [Rhodoplanes serenus]